MTNELREAAQRALRLMEVMGVLEAEVDDLRAALTATTNEAAAKAEKRLDAEARVGNGVFGVGVPERLVIEAAQRAAKHPQGGISEEAGRELRQMIADNAGRAAFLESHPAVSEELARLIEENERLSAAIATQPVQAQGGEDDGTFHGRTSVLAHLPKPATAVDRGLSEADVSDDMAMAFHRSISDGSIGTEDVEEIKTGLRAAISCAALSTPSPVAPEPETDSVQRLMSEMRALGDATLQAPGKAIKVPELVATEGRKFMRGEPSLFDRIPLGDINAIASAVAATPAEPVAPGGVPSGWVLVPLRMTRAMSEAVEVEGWQWEDLLAAAESITEEQYEEIATPPAPASEAPREVVLPEMTDDALDRAVDAWFANGNGDDMEDFRRRMRAAFSAARAYGKQCAEAGKGDEGMSITPGPLHVFSVYAQHEVRTESDSLVAVVQNRDDARLFSSAPELLEALQDMLRIMEQHEQLSGCASIVGDDARAAIAKATGAPK